MCPSPSLGDKIGKQRFPKENGWGPWFREHSDADWELTPNLYRGVLPKRGLRIIEDELRQEFIIRAPNLSAERPQNSWEWYFLDAAFRRSDPVARLD
jgi:hypothetical protein